MTQSELPGNSAKSERWNRWDWTASLFLFLGTSGVVLWQNSRLAVLWDLSYVLENSYRISLGDLPYRDFPFPYAPATFLIQAMLIKLTGRIFFHHVLYCAIVGGLGTILAWRVLVLILRGAVPQFRLVAFFLAAPLTVLGIYSIFPHPFYDPDCSFAILCGILLLLHLEREGFPPLRAFLTGMVASRSAFREAEYWARVSGGRCYGRHNCDRAQCLAQAKRFRLRLASGGDGLRPGVGDASPSLYRWPEKLLALDHRIRRVAPVAPAFLKCLLPIRIHCCCCGSRRLRPARLLSRRNWRGSRMLSILSVTLMAAPFLWALLYLFVEDDPSERAERLLGLWPVVLVVALLSALWDARRGPSVTRLLPFILIGTVQGAFLSQQLWGSTYALWPLLIILLAGVLAELPRLGTEKSARQVEILAASASLCMLISGGFYIASHERLDYADLSNGEMARSTLPALAGLSTRGLWIPQFEELVHYTDREIPKDQGLLMIPGEDLFYYATGRRPRFPVLMFDHTINPYSPEEIVELGRRRNICWLIVKKQLQLNADPVEDKTRLLELLRSDFAPIQSLTNYDIYRGNMGGSCSGIQ